MPPKKRKQAVESIDAAPPAPASVTTARGKTYDTTAAASRPKRSTAMAPPDQPTPKKAKAVNGSSTSGNGASSETPKKRGRPPKNAVVRQQSSTPKTGRIGDRKSARLSATPAPEVPLPPLRKSRSNSATNEDAPIISAPPKKRGRPARKQPSPADEESFYDETYDANITEATTIRDPGIGDIDDDETSFWLMKAEPDSRIEKNANGNDVDVKFTIDMLRDCAEPEPWDGIRNPQARNNLKAMKTGDLAFFYESNCKKPGVVGIMEVSFQSLENTAQMAFLLHQATHNCCFNSDSRR